MPITWRNSSPWKDWFLRRMLRWIMREMDLPRDALRGIYFRKRNNIGWSGRAFLSQRRIVVSIGSGGYPLHWSGYKRACKPQDGSEYLRIMDATEAVVITTAHELGHLRHAAQGKTYGRGMEDMADPPARMMLRRFREHRDELMAEWSQVPERVAAAATVAKPSTVEQRAAKVAAALARWERKAKLAKTKVAAYRRKVKYYQRKAAAR